MTDRETTPRLEEVLRAAMEAFAAGLFVACPGEIVSYDSSKQLADVKPQVKQLIVDLDGNEELLDLPVVPSVPVGFPRGGGFFMSLPMAVGDQVLLVFCDREINTWKSKGGNVDAADPRNHALSDAVAIPGCWPISGALSGSLGSHMVLGKEGSTLIYVKDGEIALGELNPVQKILLGTAFRTAQATLDANLQNGWTALATVMGALATAFTALGAIPAHNPTCSVAAAACTTAAAACTAASGALATFESTASATQDFQSNTVKAKL